MPYLVLKFLHIGLMFLATACAVGPILVFILILRTGDTTTVLVGLLAANGLYAERWMRQVERAAEAPAADGGSALLKTWRCSRKPLWSLGATIAITLTIVFVMVVKPILFLGSHKLLAFSRVARTWHQETVCASHDSDLGAVPGTASHSSAPSIGIRLNPEWVPARLTLSGALEHVFYSYTIRASARGPLDQTRRSLLRSPPSDS